MNRFYNQTGKKSLDRFRHSAFSLFSFQSGSLTWYKKHFVYSLLLIVPSINKKRREPSKSPPWLRNIFCRFAGWFLPEVRSDVFTLDRGPGDVMAVVSCRQRLFNCWRWSLRESSFRPPSLSTVAYVVYMRCFSVNFLWTSQKASDINEKIFQFSFFGLRILGESDMISKKVNLR